ncbi:MAG TPA: GNAT family N-acetyltransferase [Salinarimonas sp.]|nr:GNAT family N-acetyltransferase [Salinarimonas sp.]
MSAPAEPEAYHVRPMTRADLPLARRWLETPEVRRWWGDPDEQAALLEADLSEPGMRMWIVSWGGRPFAYVQDYDPAFWGLPPFAGVPPGSRGMDPFIGEPDMLGRGHGAAFLRAHADRLLAQGAPAVFIDPDPRNERAIRAYGKAGFEALGERLDPAGDRILLMLRRPPGEDRP